MSEKAAKNYLGAIQDSLNSPNMVLDLRIPFNQRYQQRWGALPDAQAALGYDSAMLAVDAIRRAGTTDGPKLRDTLAATQDYPAVTGLITFDALRNPTKSAVVLTIKNGRFAFVQSVRP